MGLRRGRIAGAGVAGLAVLCLGGWIVGLNAQAADESSEEVATVPAVVPGWSLDLAEDFHSVDGRTWTLQDDTFSSNEDSFLRSDSCSIDDAGADGHALRLQAAEDTVRRWGLEWDYTSCAANTEGKYSVPDWFRAEVRAKVPMEQGMWAAPLWFRPADGSGGEIDLVETLGSERARPRVHQTLHTDYGSDHELATSTYPFEKLDDPAGTGWHTYTIEKVPGRITMWVDGVQTAQWGTGDPGWFTQYYDAGKRWHLRVNLQVGGTWGGRPDASTDWSPDRTAMLVDHVYVWTPSIPDLSIFPWPTS